MKRFLVVLFFSTDVLAHQAVVTTTDYESGSLLSLDLQTHVATRDHRSPTARACPSLLYFERVGASCTPLVANRMQPLAIRRRDRPLRLSFSLD